MAVEPGPEITTLATTRGPVRVRDTGGSGPAVLLVHSLLVDPDLYAPLVPLLTARGWRCVVPELPLGAHAVPLAPGADPSPPGLAALLVAVLDALGIERAHVVGVDTGGALTQLLMAHHRDRVDRVVLTACDAYEAFPPRGLRPLIAPLGSRAVLAVLARLLRVPALRRLAVSRPISHRGASDAQLVRWTAPLRDRAVREDLRAVVRAMHPRHTLAAAEANRDFPRPVLVAWGDDDRAFPRRLGDRLVAELPDARLETLPDCAAFASLDVPELLAELVDAHLRGDRAATPAGRGADRATPLAGR
jgi:pimeloyl-ACP methyl ester carboxylesterase